MLTVTPSYFGSIGIEGVFVDDGRALHDEQVQLAILNSRVRSLLAAGYDAKGVCLTGDPAEEIASYALRNKSAQLRLKLCDLLLNRATQGDQLR